MGKPLLSRSTSSILQKSTGRVVEKLSVSSLAIRSTPRLLNTPAIQARTPSPSPSRSSKQTANFHTAGVAKMADNQAPEPTAQEIQQIDKLNINSAAHPAEPLTTTISSSAGGNVRASLNPVNPLEFYRAHLGKLLSPIVGVPAKDIESRLQRTATIEQGDLTLPVPALRVKGNPKEQAKEWAAKFPQDDELVGPPRIDKDTFLSFFYKPAPLAKLVLPAVLKDDEAWGTDGRVGLNDPADPAKGKKKIVVEFSSPNIAKPFHAGHLRSTIIGGFLSNLHEAAGYDVVRINYLGDWGRQFGLLANAFEMFGSEEELKRDPINHLFDIYVKINQLSKPEEDAIAEKAGQIKAFNEKISPPAPKKAKDGSAPPPPEPLPEEEKTRLEAEIAELEKQIAVLVAPSHNEAARKFFTRMENGDEKALEIWRRFRDLSITRYKQTYARLNIWYDVYGGESTVEQAWMDRALKELKEKNLSEENKGALIVDFTKNKATKKLEKAVIQKTDGSSLYLTRELGETLKRFETYKPDQMIYVVASQQDLHMAQAFKLIELMGHPEVASKCKHINFGMVLGMSTRKGTVKFLDDILRDVGDKMHEVMKKNEKKYEQVADPAKVADILGISAVMVQDMNAKRINNYEFDINRMTSFEGDTGPYLQYAHARLCSITRKAGLSMADLQSADLSLLVEPTAIGLLRELARWPDTVQVTLKTQEPVTVLNYLFKMTHMLSSSYDVLRVVGSEPETLKARLALYTAARLTLRNGMKLVGLTPVERM